jgi:hypothetical protein
MHCDSEVQQRGLMAVDSVTLFVEHHLEELPSNYWQPHLGSVVPEPAAGVTDYVVSVHFDPAGTVGSIQT